MGPHCYSMPTHDHLTSVYLEKHTEHYLYIEYLSDKSNGCSQFLLRQKSDWNSIRWLPNSPIYLQGGRGDVPVINKNYWKTNIFFMLWQYTAWVSQRGPRGILGRWTWGSGRPGIPPLLRLWGWQREPRISKDGKDIDTMFVMCCPVYFTTWNVLRVKSGWLYVKANKRDSNNKHNRAESCKTGLSCLQAPHQT